MSERQLEYLANFERQLLRAHYDAKMQLVDEKLPYTARTIVTDPTFCPAETVQKKLSIVLSDIDNMLYFRSGADLFSNIRILLARIYGPVESLSRSVSTSTLSDLEDAQV